MVRRYLWHDYLLEDVLEAQNPTKPTGEDFRGMRVRDRPAWWFKKWSDAGNAAKREKRRVRRAQALAEALERRRVRGSRYHTRAPHRLVDRVMRLMEPGKWYGLKALARAAGMGAGEVGRVSQALKANAWAMRCRNPRWDPGAVYGRRLEAGADVEPMWLWKLTEEGKKEKARVALLRGVQQQNDGPVSSTATRESGN